MKEEYAIEDLSLLDVACPIERLVGVWLFERRPDRGYSWTYSTPGHLLHLVLRGCYGLRTDGREYGVKAGDIIYYHESEKVEWLGNEVPVSFYAIGFSAPSLAPLSMGRRVFPAPSGTRAVFDSLYDASLDPSGSRRGLTMYARLSSLVLLLWRDEPAPDALAAAAGVWRELERRVRERRLYRATLAQLCAIAHRSRASLVRDCRRATGMSPQKRLRAIRMAEAQGLCRYSMLNVTQIAEYLGYPRLHEFSREFSRYFGEPPSRLLSRRTADRTSAAR